MQYLLFGENVKILITYEIISFAFVYLLFHRLALIIITMHVQYFTFIEMLIFFFARGLKFTCENRAHVIHLLILIRNPRYHSRKPLYDMEWVSVARCSASVTDAFWVPAPTGIASSRMGDHPEAQWKIFATRICVPN